MGKPKECPCEWCVEQREIVERHPEIYLDTWLEEFRASDNPLEDLKERLKTFTMEGGVHHMHDAGYTAACREIAKIMDHLIYREAGK